MILIYLGAICFLKRKGGPDRFTLLCLLAPVAAFAGAFSFLSRVNIGIRYILPLFPFLMVLAGNLIPLPVTKPLLKRALIMAISLWLLAESFFIHPHYLAYFNQLAGGPEGGYRHLVDSNLDWGQDLKGLRGYMDREGVGRIKLSYFGTADPGQYGIPYDPLPSLAPLPSENRGSVLRKGDIVAVSATNLYPLYVDLARLGAYLRGKTPLEKIGYSLFIYRLEEDFEPGK
jgi:hypothetical protein